MRAGSQPSEAVHSRLSIWSGIFISGEDWVWRWGCLPVNVRPNTKSFGGTSSFGVVVFVMVREEGSMSFRFIVDAASA